MKRCGSNFIGSPRAGLVWFLGLLVMRSDSKKNTLRRKSVQKVLPARQIFVNRFLENIPRTKGCRFICETIFVDETKISEYYNTVNLISQRIRT